MMLFTSLLALAPEGGGGGGDLNVAAPVTGAANKILETGVLGALLILMTAFCVYSVMKWNKANEARVEDQKAMSKTLLDISTTVKDAVKDMTEASEDVVQKMNDTKSAVERLDRTIDNVVRDAVRWGYRRPTPPGGMQRGG